MRNLVSDIVSFIRSLSFMNILFFVAVILLIVLIVALVYIMRINNEIEEEEEVMKDNIEEDLDLMNISRALEDEIPKPIILNDYEKEQEEKAIISYDELIASQSKNEEVNYKEEKDIEGLKVKRVDIKNSTKPIDLPRTKEESLNPEVNKYIKEESFLASLKKLQKSL